MEIKMLDDAEVRARHEAGKRRMEVFMRSIEAAGKCPHVVQVENAHGGIPWRTCPACPGARVPYAGPASDRHECHVWGKPGKRHAG